MSLNSILTKDTICLHLKGTTKTAVINEMLDLLVTAGKVQDRASALSAIMNRENMMSTGMKHGIAIPHGKTSTTHDLVACIGISDSPVDFDSLDSEPCRIFIMTLSPLEKTGPHLQFLAELSLLFKSPEKRAEMLKAASADDILKILSE
ncbi:PTS sucrose transporter subunit IIABC [Spirochaetia bacterium]|nr:PTS sucrose transporter subunit IIABC [Spirochaetia bacterium]